MPKDNIDRAIKKGTGELEGVSYEEILYEAYGPGGVAILIDILTDNKNRAAAEIRNLLNKGGGNLGAAGSVAYLFKRKGLINYDASKYKEDDILAVAIDAGAEDVSSDGDSIEVTTSPEDFENVVKALEAKGSSTPWQRLRASLTPTSPWTTTRRRRPCGSWSTWKTTRMCRTSRRIWRSLPDLS